MANRRTSRSATNITALDRGSVLRRRAFRHAQKGDFRKASVALRQLVAIENSPRSWVLLGAMLVRGGKTDDALLAYRQGLYFHRQSGSFDKARSVARLILGFAPDDPIGNRFAA